MKTIFTYKSDHLLAQEAKYRVEQLTTPGRSMHMLFVGLAWLAALCVVLLIVN